MSWCWAQYSLMLTELGLLSLLTLLDIGSGLGGLFFYILLIIHQRGPILGVYQDKVRGKVRPHEYAAQVC